MASPEEPHKKAATELPQVHVVQELLPSVHDLLLLKEKMTANRVPFSQNVVPQPLQNTARIVVDESGEKEKVNGFEDEKNGGRKDVLDESRKDRKGKKKKKKKLSSQSTPPPEQAPSPASSWLPETEGPWNNPSHGGLNTKEKSHGNGSSPGEVLKPSPTRLEEVLHDTSTPLHLPSQAQSPPLIASPSLPSPTKHASTTNPTTTSPIATNNLPLIRPQPSVEEQTFPVSPTMGRSKSFPRALQLNTQTSPPSPAPRSQVSQQRGRDTMSPRKSSMSKTPQSSVGGSSAHTLSPKTTNPTARSNKQNRRDSNPPTPTHTPTTTHLLKSAASIPSASFPPLPLQTYFSLTLASPTSHAPPSTFHSPQKPGPTQSNTHNLPQHHPDDSSAIAFERITNFLILPGKLEGVLWFGMLACLDSWLYMFTILPLRFVRALGVLCAFWWGGIKRSLSWGSKTSKPRRRSGSTGKSESDGKKDITPINTKIKREKRVSDLQPSHKADILRGLVVFTSCWILMRFDASRMYHSIRGQSGVKLYVIYNMLEVWTPFGTSIIRNVKNFTTAQFVGKAQLIHVASIRSVTGCALRWGRIYLNVSFPRKRWKEAQMDVVKF